MTDQEMFMLLYCMNEQRNSKKDENNTKKKKSNVIDKSIIEERLKTFEEAKINIKKEFFGIDKVIDEIFDQIKTWYVYPEYMTRPTIINLWGLTGVGKTDFVKKLRAFLKIEDFCDIETDSNADSIRDLGYRYSGGGNGNSVLEYLGMAGISTNVRNIILFDEIHRYRTLDENGKLSPKYKFSDIWKFLSDGSLVDESYAIQVLNDEINKLENKFNNIQINLSNNTEDLSKKIMYAMGMQIPRSEAEIKAEQEMKDKFIQEKGYIPYEVRKKMTSELDNFNSGDNTSASISYIISCIEIDDDDLSELKSLKFRYQGWSSTLVDEVFDKYNSNKNGKISKYLKRCSDKVMLEWLKYKRDKMVENKNKLSPAELRMEELNYVYARSLVFICGNIPKNLYDDKGKDNVTKEDVLEFLKKLFTPEQISRFGNNYIVYPVLDKAVYDDIIEREILLMQDKIRTDFETNDVTFDVKSVKREVYNNLPENYEYNGVRPVYSEVQRVLSKIIPDLIIKATSK